MKNQACGGAAYIQLFVAKQMNNAEFEVFIFKFLKMLNVGIH